MQRLQVCKVGELMETRVSTAGASSLPTPLVHTCVPAMHASFNCVLEGNISSKEICGKLICSLCSLFRMFS